MTIQAATAAQVASLAALVLVFPEPASAGIDPASYQHVDVARDYQHPGGGGVAGGYISCPAGTKAVASGATASGNRDILTAGLTTVDGNGAFAIAQGFGGGRLQISARCVDAAQVQDSTLATTAVRDHRPTGYFHAGRASCPPGTVAYGGGGFFSQPGSQPFGGDSVYASMPDADGTGWFFAAAGGLFPGKEMWISTHCLPRAQFGEIVTVTETAPPWTPGFSQTLFAAARCPFGFSAYAGGAWWHRGPSTPERVGTTVLPFIRLYVRDYSPNKTLSCTLYSFRVEGLVILAAETRSVFQTQFPADPETTPYNLEFINVPAGNYGYYKLFCNIPTAQPQGSSGILGYWVVEEDD